MYVSDMDAYACIGDFQHIRPTYEIEQHKALDWIAKAHALAEEKHAGVPFDAFYDTIKEKMGKIGLTQAIATRGVHIPDLFEEHWDNMPIYPVTSRPTGMGFKEKSAFFDAEVSKVMHAFYPPDVPLPPHLIHVTCTGYVAPSPAQKLVSERQTHAIVTHAYHMGCYASLPAIRMAMGYAFDTPSVDIVHTELCSLHMHPLNHSTDQLVVQGLFADGFIKYRVQRERPSAIPHFRILNLHEELVANSMDSMTWRCGDNGLSMTLGKEVPVYIQRALPDYLNRLFDQPLRDAYFAIHPGGPKILHYIAEILKLEEKQYAHSVQALKQFGNMSSATLPHIWEMMLNDDAVPKGARVISLAFGPGLTISGGVFEKC